MNSPDITEARRHLTLLDGSTDIFVFQTFDDNADRKAPRLAKVLSGTLEQHFSELCRYQQQGAGVFVTVNHSRNGGRKKPDIDKVRAVFREADKPGLLPLPLESHFVIETSPGKCHEYLLVEHSDDIATWDAVMTTMVEKYGSDPKAKDVSRALRLAGFYHLKNPATPHMVRIVHEANKSPYPLAEVARVIPPTWKVKSTAQPAKTASLSTKYGEKALANELATLAGTHEGERNDQLNRSAFALGQLVAGGVLDRSQVEAGLLGVALSIGLSHGEATATIRSGLEAGAKEPRTVPEKEMQHSRDEGGGDDDIPDQNRGEPELKVVRVHNILEAEPSPPAYTIDHLIPEGEVTLKGGHGGAGKSILALILAAHNAVGRAWNTFKVKGGRTLFVSLEDPGERVTYRLRNIVECYGLDAATVEDNLIVLDGSDSGGFLMSEYNDHGVKHLAPTPLWVEVKTAATGCSLIVIDNASDAFGGSENDRRQVRSFIRELRHLAKGEQAGVLLLAHIDKSAARYGAQGNSYSGSTAWHNSVRSRLALTTNKDYVELVQEKLNVGKKLDRPIRLQWSGGVLMPDSGASGDPHGVDALFDGEAVLEAIQKAIAEGENVPTARTGTKTTQQVLERYPYLPQHLKGKRGRDAFYSALSALLRERKVLIEEYKTPDRHTRQKIVCDTSSACVYSPYTPSEEPPQGAGFSALIRGVAAVIGSGERSETGASMPKGKPMTITLPTAPTHLGGDVEVF